MFPKLGITSRSPPAISTRCSPSTMPSESMTSPQQPVDALAGKLKRTELQHKASSIPDREIVQVLTEIPAGVESGWNQPLASFTA
jgi:hypothetical protein